ncbi:MAG: trypsin-like peptidase domain-containing protein [Bryobacteraceae bacterium]|jgi:serine protease Do
MNFFDKLRTEKLLSFTLVVLTLCVGIVIGTVVTVNWGVHAAKGGQAAPGASPLVIPNPVELSTAFSQIAKQVEPSVVNITIKYAPRAASRSRGGRPTNPDEDQGDSGGIQDFFRYFGGNPFGQMPEMTPSEAEGSGVVVDKAGYILTNNHVVENADRIQVKFTGDSTLYEAKVVGTDEPTDLAVIRVEGKTGIVSAKIGNSEAVQVGDWAIAIGSPFGFQATMTAGIISAKEREVDPSMQYQRFLQTDAAINPGNSGGPLLNIRGEVIGINTAIATNSRGYQGVGFALPINTAADVYNQIIKNGKVTRGSIGVGITRSDTDSERANLKLAGVSEGAFVESLVPGGPAEKAGVETGDVIVSLEGKPVHSGNDLISSVIAIPVGNTVPMGVVHDGQRKDVKVQIGDITQVWPEKFGGGSQQSPAGPAGPASRLGISIQPLNDQRRQTLGITQSGGVQITAVDSDSFAEDIGLLANDVILSINRRPVNSVEDVQAIQATLKPGDAVQFRILRRAGRGGSWTPTFVAGMLPATPR